MSFCPSVCLSVRNVPVSDENGLTYRDSFFIIRYSPIILVLSASNIFTKFRRGHPLRGAKYRWGIKMSRFSTNKSLYLANDTTYRHSYYGRRIGNRTQAFEWHQFQWTYIILEIKRDIGRKSRFFSYPLRSTPPLGGLRRNIAILSGVEKLWWGYLMVNNFWGYVQRCRENTSVWRTNGRTNWSMDRSWDGMFRAMRTRRAVKTDG